MKLKLIAAHFKKIIVYAPIIRTVLTLFFACILLAFSGLIGEKFNESSYLCYIFIFYIVIQCCLIFFQKKYWQWRISKIIFWSCYFVFTSNEYAKAIEDYQEHALKALMEAESFQSINGHYPSQEQFGSYVPNRFKNRIRKYSSNLPEISGLGVSIKNYTKRKVLLPKISSNETTITVMYDHPSIPFRKCYFHRVKQQWFCWDS